MFTLEVRYSPQGEWYLIAQASTRRTLEAHYQREFGHWVTSAKPVYRIEEIKPE